MKEQKKESSSVGKIIAFILIAFVIIIVLARYATDEEYRSFIDANIFKKQVSEENLTTIEINPDSNPLIYSSA